MEAEQVVETQGSVERQEKKKRIVSVDVLRGFDMFWITGGAGFFLGIGKLLGPSAEKVIHSQLRHSKWAGCTFYDLIFPLFVFLIGMSITFSLGRYLQREGAWAAHKRLVRRTIILYLLGILYYGGFANHWPHIRLVGVLPRLAFCYFFAGLAFCHLRVRGMVVLFLLLILGYWAFLTFVPVPGVGHPTFAMGKNWACYIDQHYLPGRRWYGEWDPEGLLSTLPAIASCLLGVFAGLLITSERVSPYRKVALFIGGGAVLAALGWLWGLQFPVIKKIWTSSYVLVTGGYSFMLVGLFYLLVDVWKWSWWTAPFIWIGMNPITIYLARQFFDFNGFALRFVGGDIQDLVGPDWGYFLKVSVSLALTLAFVRFLYKRNIFIRI